MHVVRSLRPFAVAILIVSAMLVDLRGAQDATSPGDPLIAAFRSTYPASVSDAVELG